ncbi:hypothetical protein [Amycolatopsis sp.]|uniref:hypothetical protein n=1 Tax=Amycolatopsis sp. TaxID=37632 RepID=UPI0026378993|nr:hypothetical protein [Amycolatopsis sp.]
MNRRCLVAVAPFFLVAFAGCTSTVSGQPNPAVVSSSATTPAPGSSVSDPFAGIDLCSLVDQAVAGQGFPAVQPNADFVASGRRECETKKPEFGTVGIQVQVGATFDKDLPAGSTGRSGHLNGRPFIQATNILGTLDGCDIVMEVKPNSRAIVGVTLSTGTTDDACTYVGQFATKVEPLLPKVR